MINVKLMAYAAIFGIAAQTVSACGSESPDNKVNAREAETSGATDQSPPGRLVAGEAAAALGVTAWELSPHGLTRAFDRTGGIAAEFVLDGKQGAIRMVLPDVGARSFEDPRNNTLSTRSAHYVDAFVADLEANLPRSARGEPSSAIESKGVYACYSLYPYCWNQCDYGIVNGWWIGCDCRSPWQSCPDPSYPIALLTEI